MTVTDDALLNIIRGVCKKVAPVWPLENFVAVNPFLGQTGRHFEDVAHDLAVTGGIHMTLPASFYLEKLDKNIIRPEDLATVLANRNHPFADDDDGFVQYIKNLPTHKLNQVILPTVADVATEVTKKDWNRFVISRISTWAASYFDAGQASWNAADQASGLFSSWKKEAGTDLTPEITGLKGFRNAAQNIPDDALTATRYALSKLDIPEGGLSRYLYRLLLKCGGWSAWAARLDWENELYGGSDGELIEFLAVLLCWEACLLECTGKQGVLNRWDRVKLSLAAGTANDEADEHLLNSLILQEAFERSAQRKLISKFSAPDNGSTQAARPVKAQAIFCIDVRSEVYRRNLERVGQDIETLGFAGFFAFPVNHIPIGRTKGDAHCPVLLRTGADVKEQIPDRTIHEQAVASRTANLKAGSVWKSFKCGAITCFSFVSPIGLSYLFKIFTDSYGLTRPVPRADEAGLKKRFLKLKMVGLDPETDREGTIFGISAEQRVHLAKSALKAMSLTHGFAPLVMIVGHGSTTVNNPHASGLDCGACGGRSGEPNAKIAAAVLNDPHVRSQLLQSDIRIPEETIFLACLHDTTTDELTIFNEYEVPANRTGELNELKNILARAGQATRLERSLRIMPGSTTNADQAIRFRSRDWSQTRPEWGLAGCAAFVVAPRERTRNIDFGGRSFLHSYNWNEDNEFAVLELIMTAPMVVASWISLQYYGSTVDNISLGSGNKVLHNVTAGVGVIEGYSGDLRVGLPWQSVHDGETFQHDPLKLNVIVEAPIPAMNAILEKHESIRNLCDNGWLHLWAMDEEGNVSHRYTGRLTWKNVLQHDVFGTTAPHTENPVPEYTEVS
ncbi:MAG: DUF2309 domain-containing protein [Rhodothermaceae bacterium]|nr:DUF2309 domain-containing protein [Rhodothermaceae bacterium]